MAAAKLRGPRGKTFSLGLAAAIVAFSAIVAMFYGASHYKAATGHAVQLSAVRAQQFQVVFEEFLKELFGTQALFANLPHQATVTAQTSVLLYRLSRDALRQWLDKYPELVNAFAERLAELNAGVLPATAVKLAGRWKTRRALNT